jgi:hypothetical protein
MMPADHALQSKQNNLKNEKKNHGKSVCDECCQKKKEKRKFLSLKYFNEIFRELIM